jgi:hypothetical protein
MLIWKGGMPPDSYDARDAKEGGWSATFFIRIFSILVVTSNRVSKKFTIARRCLPIFLSAVRQICIVTQHPFVLSLSKHRIF